MFHSLLKTTVTLVLCSLSLSLLAQKYSINANSDALGLNSGKQVSLLDNEYNWTGVSAAHAAQLLIGYSKYLNKDLSIGVNASFFKTVMDFAHYDSLTNTHRSYKINHLGLGIEAKQVIPILYRIFYTKLNLSYYRLIRAKRKTEINVYTNPSIEEVSISNDWLGKNVFNSFAEFGVQFPLWFRDKPIRIQGSIGLRLYQHYSNFIDFEDSVFITRGIHFGVTMIRL